MRKVLSILTFLILFQNAFVLAQCPDQDALWTRLTNLRSSKLPTKELLSGLLSTRDSMVNCGHGNDSTYIYLLRKIADLYFLQADYTKTVEYRRQAIEITTANESKSFVKQNSLPGLYYWLSVAYDSLNNFAGKMNALDSSAAIAMRSKHIDRASLTALYTRVEYYFDIGDYHRCIDYAIKCEQLSREYASIEPIDGAYYASSSLGWHVEALLKLKLFEPAENILADKIDEYKRAGLKNYLGLVYGQLAQVQEQKGNFEKTLVYFRQSLNYYLADKDYFNYKQTLKDIGYKVYFKHLNDGKTALAYYDKALKYSHGDKFDKIDDDFETLNIFANIGAVYVQKGLYDSAFTFFQLAFDQVKSGSTENDILRSTPQEMMQFKRNYYLTDLLINKANAFRKQYHDKSQKSSLENAIRIYKIADQLLDRFKTEQTELQSKLFWRSDSRRLYENAIEACYLQGNITDAFYFFEKSRAVLLNDQLNENRFVAEQDIMKQTEEKKKIRQIQIEIGNTEKTSSRFSELQSMLFERKQELDRLQQLIKTNNPFYYQSFLDTTFISIRDIKQTALSNHGALLEIFSGDSAVYILLLTSEGSHFEKIDRNKFLELTGSFVDYVSNSTYLNNSYENFRRVSSDLYQLIFRNIKLSPGRLIISPDGQYFPFEALITNGAGQPIKWFMEDYAISYAYSARFLMNDFDVLKTRGSNFFGMAPVNYPAGFALAALPGSDQSLFKIAGYFNNGVSRTRSEASRRNFLKQFSNYRIIQLYTHAADSSANNEPVIYFADSALYLSDLINEAKPLTRLIVLSACETGSGKNYQGEGVFSFNRGFAAMGIPAAISYLWSVENASTYRLTELFFKHLSGGMPADIALQKAKLEFLQSSPGEKTLPFFWAAPVLVGKASDIKLNKTHWTRWLIPFAVICMAGITLFWIYRKKSWQKKGDVL